VVSLIAGALWSFGAGNVGSADCGDGRVGASGSKKLKLKEDDFEVSAIGVALLNEAVSDLIGTVEPAGVGLRDGRFAAGSGNCSSGWYDC